MSKMGKCMQLSILAMIFVCYERDDMTNITKLSSCLMLKSTYFYFSLGPDFHNIKTRQLNSIYDYLYILNRPNVKPCQKRAFDSIPRA